MPGNVQEINCCCLQAKVISKKGAGGNNRKLAVIICWRQHQEIPKKHLLILFFRHHFPRKKTRLTAFQGNNVLQHQKKIKTHQPINQSYCRVNQVWHAPSGTTKERPQRQTWQICKRPETSRKHYKKRTTPHSNGDHLNCCQTLMASWLVST